MCGQYPNDDYDNWAEEIDSLKATLSTTRGIVAFLQDELKKARDVPTANAPPFKNCDDRDDCQYPDCGCPISFSNVVSNPADTGTMIVTHGTDGAVTVMVRSPQSAVESTITMPLADWWSMVGLSTPSASR